MSLFKQVLLCGMFISFIACGAETNSKAVAEKEVKTPQKILRVKETTTAGDIHIVVDETFKPVIESAIEVFEETYLDANVEAIYLPGEEAIRAMLDEDSLRLVISSRDISKTEQAYLQEQNAKGRTTRIATDAISFISNPSNPVDALTYDQLTDILKGSSRSWKDIPGSQSKKDIIITYDHANSSTVQFIRDSVLQSDKLPTENVFAATSNTEVIEYVAKTPNAIGIIGVSWISDQDDEKTVTFLNQVNVLGLVPNYDCSFSKDYRSFQPYQAFIKTGCYPVNRGIYTVSREPFIGLGTGFVAFLASDNGQRIFHKSGLVPEIGITRLVRFPN